MRTALLLVALATPVLLTTGCKKKEPEPAPVATQPAPKPAFDAEWGPATFVGSRAEGNTGQIVLPFTVTNNSAGEVNVDAVGVHFFNGEEKVCGGKVALNTKAAVGASVSGKLEIPCDYKALPSSEKLPAKTNVVYTAGGEAQEFRNTADIAFTR